MDKLLHLQNKIDRITSICNKYSDQIKIILDGIDTSILHEQSKSTCDEYEDIYKKLRIVTHPDKGGK